MARQLPGVLLLPGETPVFGNLLPARGLVAESGRRESNPHCQLGNWIVMLP